MAMPYHKYQAFPQIALADRRWPNRTIDQAPTWCAVDLRDGNQALIEPMGIERKRRMFELLVRMGFKEIEVGFPSASQTDYDFLRMLIDKQLIPDDVAIQVLTPSREELIERTFEAIAGAPQAIVHLYNSTSTLQRRVVFGLDRAGIVEIAVRGAEQIRRLAERMPNTEVRYEYSPESFTGTELDFAVEITEAVMNVWEPTSHKKMIINLPATVEMATPNIYADQIEWFCRTVKNRSHLIVSTHPHNDRGTAVAAAELAQLAGAERVEGTLFGNGERTGNVDIVTLGLNLFSQGVDPGLDLREIDEVVRTVEYCNQMPVHPRHPYGGELVFTAFSGSHQDAIKKGLSALAREDSALWEVPYLPIDPKDIGRTYEAVVRINSQSGKSGIAYVLEADHGIVAPRRLQIEFSRVIQEVVDASGQEISSNQIYEVFAQEYLAVGPGEFALLDQEIGNQDARDVGSVTATLVCDEQRRRIVGEGHGPIEAFIAGIKRDLGVSLSVCDYTEHAAGSGADAIAWAYIEVEVQGTRTFGVGYDANIIRASLSAIVSALNRLSRSGVVRVEGERMFNIAS